MASVEAHKLLRNPKVKAYVEERMKSLEDKAIAKQDEVLRYLTSVMRGEHTEQITIGMGEGLQAITDIDVSAKDRIKAAELLGKRYSTWTDKSDVNMTGTVVFLNEDEIQD